MNLDAQKLRQSLETTEAAEAAADYGRSWAELTYLMHQDHPELTYPSFDETISYFWHPEGSEEGTWDEEIEGFPPISQAACKLTMMIMNHTGVTDAYPNDDAFELLQELTESDALMLHGAIKGFLNAILTAIITDPEGC